MLRSVKYGLHGAVLAGLIAAPVVWNGVDKTVHLTVDGKASTVRTTERTVGEVLDARGLDVGRHDLVAPATRNDVTDGMDVVVRRGRQLHLDIDGKRVSVWTTARTVSEALAQLGYDTDDFVSVSRSRRLPLAATAIAIRTPRSVTVIHDGKRDRVTTTSPTVGAMLHEMGVDPDSDDRVSVAMTAPTADGQTILVQRVGRRTLTRTELVRYDTSKRNDAKLTKGTTKVVTKGRDGKARVTYSIVYVDGKLAGRTRMNSIYVTKPRTKVVAIGTKQPPAGTPAAAQAFAREFMKKKYGWGADQYSCLVSMWHRESGWRANAENSGSGAYGIPQALPGSKMASAGSDWQTNAETQVKWGLGYVKARYSTPCGAWGFWQAHNYY